MQSYLAGVMALLIASSVSVGVLRAESTADVRADLDILNNQVQQLRDQLVQGRTAQGLPVAPATALERLDQMEARLRELTDRVDVLTNDIARIVSDASNRAGDLEFRLTELEGGDPGGAGSGDILGGGLSEPPNAFDGGAEAAQLAVAEKSDFDTAARSLGEGRPSEALGLLDTFLATYPGGPLSNRAALMRADALGAQGNWQEAARGYLNAFSGAPNEETAPTALFGLGVSLAKIDKVPEACLTWTEVVARYPASPEAADVATERSAFNCP
ncbi:MAG: tetratricopeptide repeat protein [Pseudomonadota bacterium]